MEKKVKEVVKTNNRIEDNQIIEEKKNKPTPEQLHNKVFVGGKTIICKWGHVTFEACVFFLFRIFFIFDISHRLLFAGIPPSVDRDELKTIFEQFGTVADAIVMIDQATNRSRCFGFVTFENGSNGAQRAIDVQPLNIQGRNVEVKLATPKAEQRRQPPAAGPKHVGLRAGISSSSSSGEYAGLAVAYGRSGWKAGYGTYAFGKAGWGVQGWEDMGPVPTRTGFSFSMLGDPSSSQSGDMPPAAKRARH